MTRVNTEENTRGGKHKELHFGGEHNLFVHGRELEIALRWLVELRALL